MVRHLIALSMLAVSAFAATVRAAPQLWVYCPTNLLVNENVDKLGELWKRAAAAGYTHVLLQDSKFSRLNEMPPGYFANVARLKEIAAADGLTVIPCVFPVGYSNDLLSNDPNLAEGLPVVDQPFVVQGGEARPVPDPAVNLDAISFKDDAVSIGPDGVAAVAPGGGNARVMFALNVKPHRCYHVSVKIKTENRTGARPEIKVLAGERSLQWQNLKVEPTQDWARQDVVFNSLENEKVTVYLGVWGDRGGLLQWKDWAIDESPLVNLLRRPGAPLAVKIDGGRTLAEGVDFPAWADPKLGNNPWAGAYDSWHAPPVLKVNVPDGTRLLVSWSHPAIIYDEQVSACIAEPRTMELLADQAKRVKAAFDPPGFVMSHDEIRTMNFDASCASKHQTPGEMLAENLRRCRAMLGPADAYVWNDMFDPFHNAVAGPYYLVNGPLTDSWAGLGKDVIVMNWNFDHRDESLKFFADRGNRQIIAGYYDADLSDAEKWVASAAKVKGVVGFMYTTWRGDYDQLEAFAKICRGR